MKPCVERAVPPLSSKSLSLSFQCLPLEITLTTALLLDSASAFGVLLGDWLEADLTDTLVILVHDVRGRILPLSHPSALWRKGDVGSHVVSR